MLAFLLNTCSLYVFSLFMAQVLKYNNTLRSKTSPLPRKKKERLNEGYRQLCTSVSKQVVAIVNVCGHFP